MRLESIGRRSAGGAASVLGRSADAAITAFNALVPRRGYSRAAGLPYGPHPRQKLDVYLPQAAAAGAPPAVVFFYGGSWKFGERAHYRFVGEALATHGVIAVIADYRLYPEVAFPAFVHDGANALSWVREHLGKYGGDPDALFVMGHSAGANIAALIALDPGYGVAPGAVRGLIGLAGPYAFRPVEIPSVREIYEGAPTPRTRPVAFVGAANPPPPAFLAHGRKDANVHVYHTEEMSRALRRSGGAVREAYYDRLGHVGLIGAFARPFRRRVPILADVTRFISDTVAGDVHAKRTHASPRGPRGS